MEDLFDQRAAEAEHLSFRKVHKEGIEEGRWVGRQEGIREGQMQTILKVAHARFGTVPQKLETLLQAATPKEMDSWRTRIATSYTIDDAMKGSGSCGNRAVE